MSNNDPQAEEMKEYFERAQKYWSEELNIEKLLQVVEEAAGIEIDPTSEANKILGRMWEVVASSVVVKGVLIEKQEDTTKIYDAADAFVKKAILCYERFVTTHSNSAEAHEALGNAYWSQDLEKALAEYELALKYDPNNPDYNASIKDAKNSIEEGKPARDSRGTLWTYFVADSFLGEVPVEKIETRIEESFNKGFSLYDEGKYAESIEYFNESLELSHELSREYTQIWYFKGHSLGHLGRKEGAIDCFEEVLSRVKDPDDLMEIHGLLGRLILLGTLEEPKHIPTKDDLSEDELKKALKHLNEGITVFEELSLEKRQEWANLYEPLEQLRELAKNLIMQRG
jgi:tetratricopeptide (TPR) repeat protein